MLLSLSLLVLLGGLQASTHAEQATNTRVVEIRSYNLKPGTRDHFQALFEREALPLLKRWKVDVVAYGPSPHDADSWFLMRGFASVAQRQKDEDAFYASDEWTKGPRAAVLAGIDTYATIVVSVDSATLNGLRQTGGRVVPRQ